MPGVVSIAYELGLPACAEALSRDRIARLPHGNVRVATPSLLAELRRFGPSPASLQTLLEHCPPSTKAWIADDLMHRVLWLPADERVTQELRRAAAEASAETIAPTAALLFATTLGVPLPDLSSAFAEAHLPRLACALLPADALGDAAEILLDAELFAALPDPAALVGDGTPAEIELAGYVAARTDLAVDPASVAARLALGGSPSGTDADTVLAAARSHVVRAEAALRAGHGPVALEPLDHIARHRPHWRYAHRIRIAAALAAAADELLFRYLDDYLDRFGNDPLVWRTLLSSADRAGPAFDRLRLRLCAEIAASPRDAVPWTALVETLVAPAAVAELRQRRGAHDRLRS